MTAVDINPPTYSRGHGAPASATRAGADTVVCAACGCRLTTRESADDAGFTGARTWYHFAGAPGRDARGCSVSCAEAAHTIA